MNKHLKIVVLSLVVVGAALAGTVMLLSRPEPSTVSKTIPYLASLKSSEESEMLTSVTSRSLGTLTNKMRTTTYEINEKYEVVRDALKKDLKSRATSASSYPTKNSTFTMINMGMPGKSGTYSVTIRKASASHTTVGLVENRSLNPVDRIKLWYAGVTGKSKGGITVVANGKPIR